MAWARASPAGGGLLGPCCVGEHVDRHGCNGMQTQSDHDEDKQDVPARPTGGGRGEVWPAQTGRECRPGA